LQGRDQCHPAGDELRVFVAREELRSIIEARRLLVIEFIHRCSPYSAASCCWWMARQIFSGVAGISRWRTPWPFSASTMALEIAAGAPIAPASPQPLTPSGLCVQ